MNKRKATRLALLLFLVALIVLVIGVAISHPVAQPPQGRGQSTPTAQPTTVPTSHATSKPTIVPTIAPIATTQPVIVATHAVLSNAQLGSTLASFKAKYGQDTPQTDSVTDFIDATDNGPLLHGGVLGVTYSKSGVVTYITYAGPDNWTHKQYVAMMLAWIPSDAVVVKNTPALSTYSSVSIGRFDEQFTDVVAAIYRV